ncbi:endonuclease/exonuclease/phosphatase family protein [Streptomyces sp. Qhu-G9]|uniref:endonuclease/exonuclease/phosphatase family protein n=1 Tax=Streptomyces sp. Qhu-G9 TaxID=3452799 RepID=UPI0022AC0647|nr:endonuclease/exonuclease/phosphatase family protein [Streptomyces aurantiacus]WAU80308.1 endonuclease/exonuclease/phosphatase family protein [Streptomyces aurantiacus]
MLLGTWNLENLYRPGGAFGPRTEAAYKAKLTSLAAVVRELDPTLLGVQEVGDPEALEDLAGMLDGDWHIVLSEHPDSRGIRVGFLSRTAPRTITDTNDFPPPLRAVQGDDDGEPVPRTGRGILAVEMTAQGMTLSAAVCHLKSKLLTYPGKRFQPRDEGERARYGAYALFRRAAEATTLRTVADGLLDGKGKKRNVAVLGDLNDEVAAATTQIPLGPAGSEIGTVGFERPDRGDAARLWNIAPLIPEEQRFSRVHAGRPELIDHILVSRLLLDHVTGAGTGAPVQETPLPSVDEDPAARRDAAGSDHAPVWARIEP